MRAYRQNALPDASTVGSAIASTTASTILPILAVLLTACGANRTADPGAQTAGPADYPVLVGRFAEEGVREPLLMREAFIGDEQFYVSYESAAGLIHAGGNWSDRIDILAVEESDDGSYAGPYILPLDYQQQEPWAERPHDAIVPRQLTAEQWGRFRDGLFASVIPQEPNTGLVMHFDADDYFLFLNSLGLFESRLITDKPGDYRITEQIDFEEFVRRGLPELNRFLEEEGIDERRIVFETGDAGAYSLPFLYVDLDLPIAVFVRYAPTSRQREAEAGTTQVAQSLGHVAQSHLGGMAVRPVSSLYRLLFVTTDAAVEVVRPTWLVNLEDQPIPDLYEGSGMDLDAFEADLDGITAGTRRAARSTIWSMGRSSSSATSTRSRRPGVRCIYEPTSSTMTTMPRRSVICSDAVPTTAST